MKHRITVDLGYGDAGKGTIVQHLVRREKSKLIVRYGGGSQCAHNVYDERGRHHTFAQFGSSLDPGVKTLLSQYVLVNPLSLLVEEEHLRELEILDALDRLYIDADARITTPYHRALNRIRELARGSSRHGSCGMGIGETMAYSLQYPNDVIHAGDLRDRGVLLEKLTKCKERCLAEALAIVNVTRDKDQQLMQNYAVFKKEPREIHGLYTSFAEHGTIIDHKDALAMIAGEPAVFEGHQGVLIDENFGFHPYTTWSTTTSQNAYQLIADSGNPCESETIGVLRTYAVRHGPGPFVSERRDIQRLLPESDNGFGLYQREFRVGAFDIPATKYALRVNGNVDSLAITHCDKLPLMESWMVCTDYDRTEIETASPRSIADQEKLTLALFDTGGATAFIDSRAFITWLPERIGLPISIVSSGPGPQHKTDL